jgi:hypothetical protein
LESAAALGGDGRGDQPGRRQGDGDPGAGADPAVDGEGSVVPLDQALGERQAEAGAFELPAQPAVDRAEHVERRTPLEKPSRDHRYLFRVSRLHTPTVSRR